MTTTYITSFRATRFDLASVGDTVILTPGVTMAVTNNNGFFSSVGGRVQVLGSLLADYEAVNMIGSAGSYSAIDIGAGALVSSSASSAAVRCSTEVYEVTNRGQLLSNGSAPVTVSLTGSGNFYNYGTVTGTGPYGGTGVRLNGTSTDVATLVNFGEIQGSYAAISALNCVAHIENRGRLVGNVQLSGNGSYIDSSLGQVFGVIYGAADGSTVIAGTNGGSVLSYGGNDNLQANQGQQAANDRARFALDAGLGNNALYGGGAFNTFILGTWGAHDQVWGGKSLMSDVAGYLNNTAQFSNATQGVYVDLLNGHNAFINDSAGAWDGTGVFADWIVNVPNIMGSAYGDIIQADGTGGTIKGAGGADALYGATGADIFAYTAYAHSNTVTGYDTVVNFQRGTDKIDISAFMSANGLGAASLVLSGSGNSTTVYVERVAGTFNAATDLALVVNSTAGVLTSADFIL